MSGPSGPNQADPTCECGDKTGNNGSYDPASNRHSLSVVALVFIILFSMLFIAGATVGVLYASGFGRPRSTYDNEGETGNTPFLSAPSTDATPPVSDREGICDSV